MQKGDSDQQTAQGQQTGLSVCCITGLTPEYSLEELMLKPKLQCFGHLMRRADSLEKILMLGKIEGRRRGQERMRCLDGITSSMDMSVSKLQEIVRTGKLSVPVCGVARSQT